jgi:RND family efflux transporter MFP subunit
MLRSLPTLLVLAALAAGVGFVALRATAPAGGAAAADGARAPAAVEIAAPRSGTVRDLRVFTGSLQSSTRFEVAAEIGGLLLALHVDLGDRVEAGQVLGSLRDQELRQAVARAEAELQVREAALLRAASAAELAERAAERSEALLTRGISSTAQVDTARSENTSAAADLALAEAQVAQSQASLELARLELDRATIRLDVAPEDRALFVAERLSEPGTRVMAGDPLLAIVALDPLTVVVAVTERDYPRLAPGLRATLRADAIEGEAFEAEVVRVAPVFRETSRQARVELEVRNPTGRLKPGMFVRVSTVLDQRRAETLVPQEALVERDGAAVVFVLDQSTTPPSVRRTTVEPGIVDEGWVELRGLTLTEPVVVLGQALLDDGSLVRPVEALRTSPSTSPGPQTPAGPPTTP